MIIDKAQLKALAEACPLSEPLRLVEYHGAWRLRNAAGSVLAVHRDRSFPQFMAENEAYARFIEAASPTAILALLAEIERLERKNANQAESIRDYQDLTMGGDVTLGMRMADLRGMTAERDHLKAELAGLRTGYEAQNEVIAGLRKDAERYRELRDNGYLDSWADVHVCDEHLRSGLIDSGIDAAMWPKGAPSHG